jgi:hypothetical protein
LVAVFAFAFAAFVFAAACFVCFAFAGRLTGFAVAGCFRLLLLLLLLS